MKTRLAVSMTVAASALALAGCIHHEETVYRDAPRMNVEFESDKAARIFYEAFHKGSGNSEPGESKTDIDIPVVFHNKRRVVSGPNIAFNRAVEICDSNHDGRITEHEARVYAEHRH